MFRLCLIAATVLWVMPAFADEIKLATQREGHVLSQESELFVRCAMDTFGRKYTIIKGPWERAQRGTKEGLYNGFFVATKTKERDAYAVFSEPFYAIKWLYVIYKKSGITPDDMTFIDRRFSADMGSARLSWLEDRYNKGDISKRVTAVDTNEQILKMLLANRVDVGLMNDHGFEKSIQNLGIDQDHFQTFILRDTPAGVYFSRHFLNENPKFLEKFNRAMGNCKQAIGP